jgi:AcrR family transcriptional regulator
MVRAVEKGVRVPSRRGGLRERKKLAVRRALGSAALRLAVERGLDNVTIEEITAEAGVSVRTFGNYFGSKYEAICALGTDRARRIGAELLARPAGEPLWDALVAAMLAHYEGAGRAPAGQWLAGLRLVLTSPPIRGEYLKVASEMQQALAEAIAARTGTSLQEDMYPQVLAGAVTAAAQVAVRRWAAADPPVPLAPLLRRALDQLSVACSRLKVPAPRRPVVPGKASRRSAEHSRLRERSQPSRKPLRTHQPQAGTNERNSVPVLLGTG